MDTVKNKGDHSASGGRGIGGVGIGVGGEHDTVSNRGVVAMRSSSVKGNGASSKVSGSATSAIKSSSGWSEEDGGGGEEEMGQTEGSQTKGSPKVRAPDPPASEVINFNFNFNSWTQNIHNSSHFFSHTY